MSDRGLVYVFTGDGKGKTSAALGIVLRALTHGWSVGWVSWYKEASWGISEHKLDTILSDEAKKRLFFFPMGKGFYLQNGIMSQHVGKVKIVRANSAVIVDDDSADSHRIVANSALQKAENLLSAVDVLVLDEVCNAIHDELVDEKDVMRIVEKRQGVHLVLTGRNATQAIIKKADLVSDIKKIKHPFDSGKLAIKGLDF
ncbi:MAG: cob(I)yrinic acid a,c-diamide adenosyltransferase [Candidatus Pacebacteria bacterium]|nr:cob(I)yrinic acid a,c-diamide adenosyltransferase [Candidatus Paceibacterota bacterium]